MCLDLVGRDKTRRLKREFLHKRSRLIDGVRCRKVWKTFFRQRKNGKLRTPYQNVPVRTGAWFVSDRRNMSLLEYERCVVGPGIHWYLRKPRTGCLAVAVWAPENELVAIGTFIEPSGVSMRVFIPKAAGKEKPNVQR